jgi:outer membrane protein assembly factor BamB
MKDNTRNGSRPAQDFEATLRNVKVPRGSNPSHKAALWQILEKKEEESPGFRSTAPDRRPLLKTPVFILGLVSAGVAALVVFSIIIASLAPAGAPAVAVLKVVNGEVLINGKPAPGAEDTRPRDGDVISTGTDAAARLNLGKSSVTITAATKLAVLEQTMAGGSLTSRLRLDWGRVECAVTLPDPASVFEIAAGPATFSVKGTRFSLSLNADNDVSLEVEEGLVRIGNYVAIGINPPEIVNAALQKRLHELFGTTIGIARDGKAFLKNDSIAAFNSELSQMLRDFATTGDEGVLGRSLTGLEKKRDKLVAMQGENAGDIQPRPKSAVSVQPLPVVIRLNRFSDTALTERGTGMSASTDAVLVSSDRDKAVFAVNPANGRISWKFQDPRLARITVAACAVRDGILIGSPDTLFLMSAAGTLTRAFPLVKGINFWPDIIRAGDRAYIPTAETIYAFSGQAISALEGLTDTGGQLYVSRSGEDLYCFNLNTLEVSVYNITKKTVKTIGRLSARAFMAPILDGGFLFIADQSGNVYRFDAASAGRKPGILAIGKSVSSMVLHKGWLYFVAGDGYFYRIDGRAFKAFAQIDKVESHPNPDKALTKKSLAFGGAIYFSSDTGRVFYYDTASDHGRFLSVRDNPDLQPLVGSPVVVGGSVYVIDTAAHLFVIRPTEPGDR